MNFMFFNLDIDLLQILICVQAFGCFFMTGLIWLIQLVHYPSFEFVDKNQFSYFHEFHSKKITFIVAPVMFIELVTAFLLCFTPEKIFVGNFILVIILWALTGLVSVPIHNRLAAKYDLKNIKLLVSTNWFRTIIWNFRSILILLFMLTHR